MLLSPDPVERTGGARALQENKNSANIASLIEALKKEEKLYPRIAISETLSAHDAGAAKALVPLLGEIGQNQHRTLPGKPFEKKSYPLPRDIVARTLANMGEAALPALLACLKTGDDLRIQEALDALGWICFYRKKSPPPESVSIAALLVRKILTDTPENKQNEIIRWKAIRALSALPGAETEQLLETFLTSDVPALVWEAERSLKILRSKN